MQEIKKKKYFKDFSQHIDKFQKKHTKNKLSSNLKNGNLKQLLGQIQQQKHQKFQNEKKTIKQNLNVSDQFSFLIKNFKFEEKDDRNEEIKENIKNNKKTTLKFYKILKLIGKGSFGKVYLAIQRLTNRLVAIKCLEKQFFNNEKTKKKILLEVNILKEVIGHPNVIKLLEVFENKKYVFCVMEYASKGDLLTYLKQKKVMKEDESKYLFFQICKGLRHLHQQRIIHRDIKLDNILIDEYDHCKLCDFGVSRFMKKNHLIKEQCGTPAYLAPEIIENKGYSNLGADIWSLGVLLYCLLTGKMPFKAPSLDELQIKIVEGVFDFDSEDEISDSAKELVFQMLQTNPDQRINIKEVLQHKWLKDIDYSTRTIQKIQEYEENTNLYLESLEFQMDEMVIEQLKQIGFSSKKIKTNIIKKKFNHICACYYTIEKDFINNQVLKLIML